MDAAVIVYGINPVLEALKAGQIAGVRAIGTLKTVLSLQRVEMSACAGKCRPLAFADGMHVNRV